MTIAEIAEHFAALCRERKLLEALERYYADDMVSVEPADYLGKGREMRGKDAVRAKNAEWLYANEVHSLTVRGPFLSPECFAMMFGFDWTRKTTGERVKLEEVAIYHVRDGQIVREEFLYSPMQG